MRAVLIGTDELSLTTARQLIEQGHEVVLIESDKSVIDSISDEIDCSFLNGDGSDPAILREADPEQCDVLFCLTDNDQVNIIASLVGRSLGFARVVTSIHNPEYQGICEELGLEDVVVPSQTISRYLVDLAMGIDSFEIRTVMKGNTRLFQLSIGKQEAGPVKGLDLPSDSKVIFAYRGDDYLPVNEDTKLREGDMAVILTHSRTLPELRKRWRPSASQ
jgi:trk system potassium uptake protein